MLFILPRLSVGGAERNTLALARGLSRDFDVHLAVIRADGRLLGEIPAQATLHDLCGRLQFLFRLPALVRETRPRVVFSAFTDVSILILMTRFLQPSGTNIVVRESSLSLMRLRQKKFRRFREWLYKLAFRKADRVVVLTRRSADVMCHEGGVPRERVVVIPNAIDGARVRAAGGKGGARHRDRIRLIAVGRLEHVKGYDILLQSVQAIISEFPTVQLTIYGEGSQRDNLERDIDRLGLRRHVVLAGHTSDPAAALREADLFVLCSRFEGLSNAMLEALGSGVPVLAINNSDVFTEDAVVDGVNGFLVNELTVPALSRGMIRAINEFPRMDRDQISRDAHRRFSRDEYLARYRSLLQAVTGNR